MEFKLRPYAIADVGSLVKYANNWNIAKNLMDRFPHPYTAADGKAFIEHVIPDDPIHIFAIDISGEAVGGIGIHPQEDIYKKNAELGYWLGEPFWGKGIITRAIQQIVDYAFDTYEVNRVFARPFGTNKASQRVLEKAGFSLETILKETFYKDGAFVDEWIYAIRRQ